MTYDISYKCAKAQMTRYQILNIDQNVYVYININTRECGWTDFYIKILLFCIYLSGIAE